jgi:hypothetical protein
MRTSLVLLAPGALLLAAACSSPNSGVVAGAQDTHCASVTAQPPADYVCPSADPNGVVADPNAAADPNAPSDEGAPLYNAAGDDDDCKYHVQWSATDVRVNTDVTFMVKATWRYDSSALTGADTYIEAVGPDGLPAPNTSPKTTEGTGGNYTITPIRFDQKGQWLVRFHLYGSCDDAENSKHGHAAFYVKVE